MFFLDGKTYTGTPGLFELLSRKMLNKSLITTRVLINYRRIFEASFAHLDHNHPSDVIKTTGDMKSQRGHLPLISSHE